MRWWDVGDEYTGVDAPAPKHFVKMTKKGGNPIEVAREALEEMDIVWAPDWDLKRLLNEAALVRDHVRRTAEAKRRREEDARNNPTN
jgi:hypothetical protein